MILDDLKDKLSERASILWTQIQESTTYNSLREKYETLNPNAQRLVNIGVIAFLTLFVLSIPFSYISSSSTAIAEFEEIRSTIRKVFRVTAEVESLPPLPMAPPFADLQARIDTLLKGSQLLPEQIGQVQEILGMRNNLVRPPIQQLGLRVDIRELNLKQVVDIGQRLQNVAENIKLMGVEVKANRTKGNYFDVTYKLTAFSFPAAPAPKDEKDSKGGGS